ncbi:unnamed protein product, partial [Onchocerca ochengi]|uniref:Calmodulin n=1 Tax=Onchocerca ochengi TaxID=42157 RepID=A0A182EB96_ONCOC
MTHYDLTKDGKVDKRELRTVAYMDHKLPPTISDEIFWKADHNGDKFIDRTEIIAAVRSIQRHVVRATSRWLEDHDMDGDGRMNEMELFESIYMEHGLAMEDVNGCFRESDINKDKYLTSNELVEMLQCSRLLALKEAKELMKIYDTDGDRRLNIQEAQMLASLRYDIEPDYATIVFEDVSHRTDHTINELELIDFLTKLREEAAIAALNKLTSLDMNGDEAVSFSELLQGYEKQLKKSVLKKIFSKVDVNKNAHIDPIEYVSLQNLIADKIHLQTIQNDFEQRHSTTIDTTTFLPTLIIFRTPKKPHNKQPSRRRIRRSDSETDKKLMVSDDSEPGIKELTATNANNVYFTKAATAVPRVMELNKNYQKFISNGAKLFDMLTDSKHKEEIRRDDITKTWEKLIAGISGSTPLLMQEDRKLTSNINKDQMGTSLTTDKNGYAQEQNGALGNNPSIAYMKKFGKFFDFLEKAFKKVSEAVKENDEKQNNEKQSEFLESPLKGINIFKHLSPTDNISNIGTNEIEKIANVTEIPMSVPTTTTKKTKTRGDRKDATYRKSRNEENLIVHTPVDTSGYKTITSERLSESFDAPSLQLDNEIVQEEKEAKMIDYEAKSREEQESSSEESDLHDEEEKDVKEKIVEDCTLENGTDSFDSENSSEHQIKSIKKNKCKVQAHRSDEIVGIELLQKASEVIKKEKSNEESKNQKKRRRKLQNKNKFSSKANSLEHETTPAFLDDVENESNLIKMENKSSSISYKIYSENDNDEFTEMFPEAEGEEESGELSDEGASTKHIYFNKSSEQESADKYAKFAMQSFNSGKSLNEKLINLTDKYDKPIHSSRNSTNFKKNFAKTKEKLSSHKAVHLKEKSRLPDKESKDYKFLEPNLMFSKEENIIKKHDQEMLLRSKIADPQIFKLQNSTSEQMESQTASDETISHVLNATPSKIHQTLM